MSVKKGRDKTLAEQIAELEDPTPKGTPLSCSVYELLVEQWTNATIEFDPEDQSDGAQESDSDSGSDGVDLDTGREHYEAVRYAANSLFPVFTY